MVNGLVVDDVSYGILASVKRVGKVTSSDLSGMLLNKTYYNDVIGTYMEYQVKLVVPSGSESEYTQLYEVLTAPVPYHKFLLPYGQGSIAINARVEVVSDDYVGQFARRGEVVQEWRAVKFNVIAVEPSRVPE